MYCYSWVQTINNSSYQIHFNQEDDITLCIVIVALNYWAICLKIWFAPRETIWPASFVASFNLKFTLASELSMIDST